jgi:hypothetical protein
MWLQQLDPIFNMGVNVMRPAHNSEPKYRVTMLPREQWTKEPGNSPAVKGVLWYTDGPRTLEEAGASVYGQSLGRRLSISLEKYATVFWAEIYAILACAYKIQMNVRQEKYVSIPSDS